MNASQFTPRLLSSCARINAVLHREQADDLAHAHEEASTYTEAQLSAMTDDLMHSAFALMGPDDCALTLPAGAPLPRSHALYEPATLHEQSPAQDLKGMPTLAWVAEANGGHRVYMPTTYEQHKMKRRIVAVMSAY